MKNWFTSLSGAVILTGLAFVSELWRGFLDAMFVLSIDFADARFQQLAAVIFALLFAGWGWALAHTWRGSRRALIITFVINLVVLIVIPMSWLLFYCPAACRVSAGVFNLANTLNLIFGLLAGLALGWQIWRPSQDA